MHFHLFFVPAALVTLIVNSLPLDSADESFFLPELATPDFSSELTGGSNLLSDASSLSSISNDAEILNLDLFTPSSSEGLITNSEVVDSDFNSLLQIPDDDPYLFTSDSTAPDTFSQSIVGSDVLGLEPSFMLAGNPQAPAANKVSPYIIPVCCGHGDSLVYYCQPYRKTTQKCNQKSILCTVDSAFHEPLDESTCKPDPDSRTDVNKSDDFNHALGDTIFHKVAIPAGFGLIVCKLVGIFELWGWKCG